MILAYDGMDGWMVFGLFDGMVLKINKSINK